MPEGHTLHRIARDLHAAFASHVVSVSSPQGRFAASAARLDGHELLEARAHGKHLFIEFSGDQVLHVHLGLIGTFTIDEVAYVGERPVIGQVRCRIASEGHVADLRGPIVCALITPDEEELVHAKLGPDPLRDVDGDAAWERIRRSRKSIAAQLMDQQVLAGVGNVYRCEVLFRHRINPATPGERLKRASWDLIWADLRRLLPLGVATGRIVTVADEVEEIESALAKGEDVHLDSRTSYVYKRTGGECLRCGSTVRAKDVAGRTLYWCGNCQRRS